MDKGRFLSIEIKKTEVYFAHRGMIGKGALYRLSPGHTQIGGKDLGLKFAERRRFTKISLKCNGILPCIPKSLGEKGEKTNRGLWITFLPQPPSGEKVIAYTG